VKSALITNLLVISFGNSFLIFFLLLHKEYCENSYFLFREN